MTEQEILLLAEQLWGTNEMLWELALRRVFAQGLQCLGWIAFFLVVLGAALYLLLRGIKAVQNPDTNETEAAIAATIIGAFGSLVSAIGVFAALGAAIGRFYAPEYYAALIILALK